MRKHGKLAVLKDDEVDRLERANNAVSGTSRQDVMESMYGRIEPKPHGEYIETQMSLFESSHTAV